MDDTCALCKQEQETRDHLFFRCSFSKPICKMVLHLCGLRREVFDWDGELSWAIQKLKGKAWNFMLLRIGWNAFIYQIWKE